MWIQHTATADPDSPTGTVALRHDEHTDGEVVTFHPETGKANVTKAVGEQLIDHYASVEAVDETTSETDDSDSDTDSDTE